MPAVRIPYHPQLRNLTPEGWLVSLPLPLHWHVHSLSSSAAFRLNIAFIHLPKSDYKGRATIHQEKNWADSFPEAHVWAQARNQDSSTGTCLAGGKILGVHAFILEYRSPSLNIDLRRPFALSVLCFSPFMSHTVDFPNRSFTLSARNLSQKMEIRAKAPKEKGWFGLSAPLQKGHVQNFCTESFLAEVEVEVYEKTGWFTGWKEIRRKRFKGASIEFAGEYFEERVKKEE